MSRLSVIIADDERPAREYLKAMLAEFEHVDLRGEAENGAEAVDLIRSERPDLAILDLRMPEVSGLDAVKMLRRSEMPLIAFATAHDEYAVQAFDINAVDYLLKPVERQRLGETLRRAAERLERADWREVESQKVKNAADAYESTAGAGPIERIPVKVRDEIVLVPVREVASIVADGELLVITTLTNQRYSINFRLKDIEARLDEKDFVRLSRGAIVNLEAVDRISPLPGGTYAISLTNGQELQSSRLQSKILRERLLRL